MDRGDEDVLGFEIAVNNARGVRGGEPSGNLQGEKRLPAISVLITQHAVALERGDTKAAETMLAAITTTVADPRTSIYDVQWVPVDVVSFLARKGKRAKVGAIPPFDWLVLNPYLKGLQSDPRFKEVAAKSRLQFDEMLRIVDKARASGEMPPYLERPLKDLLARIGS